MTDTSSHEHTFEPHRFPAIGAATYCAGCGEVRWTTPGPVETTPDNEMETK